MLLAASIMGGGGRECSQMNKERLNIVYLRAQPKEEMFAILGDVNNGSISKRTH